MPHVSSATPGGLQPIAAAIKSLSVTPHHLLATEVPPFVTISRQAGAGGITLGHRLAEHLSRIDPGQRPWTAWDKELVQKVAEDHHISEKLVEALEDRGTTWLEELLGGLCMSKEADSASELRVFWKAAMTIRAIASVGRSVIVGRGGAFITRGMPGGIHIRLVGPEPFRIRNYAKIFNVSIGEAAAKVKELDRLRDAFVRRHWPGKNLADVFTATFDASAIGEWEMVKVVAAMVPVNTEA